MACEVAVSLCKTRAAYLVHWLVPFGPALLCVAPCAASPAPPYRSTRTQEVQAKQNPCH